MRTSLQICLLLAVAVVLPADEWRETSTEHFRFIYRPHDEFAVRELVGFADDVYDEVAELFESGPSTVTAVVYGETDLANGYYNPNPPQHLGLFLVQPSTAWIGDSTESWLRLLLVHELTHYLQANHSPGLFETLAAVFGSSIAGLDIGLVPLWLTEGLAIHAESRFTSGGRQADPRYELYERALIIEDRMFSLNQAGYASHLAPPGRQYVAGGFLIEYMIDEYGQEFVADFLDDFSRFPLFGMWGPIHRATGTPMERTYAAAVNRLEERYADRVALPSGSRISPQLRSDYYLPIDTDQGWYLYRTRPDRRPAIVRRAENGDETVVVSGALTDPFSWSVTANGEQVAFATVRANRNTPGSAPLESNLYLYSQQSGRTVRLTDGGGYFHPAISPDGNFLVAIRRSDGFHEVLKINLREQAQEPAVLARSPQTRYYQLSLSPDGTRAVVAENRRGVQRLLLLDTATGSARPLPSPAGANASFPRFVSERRILFTAAVDGSLRLYEVDPETSGLTEVGRDRVGIAAATRIGEQIIYRTYSADGNTLRVLSNASQDTVAAETPEMPSTVATTQDVSGTEFRPVAWPRYWLPTIGLSGGVPDLSFLGPGVVVGGRDLLGRSSWTVAALYYPGISQLGYSVALQHDLGPARLDGFAESTYGLAGSSENPYYYQRFSQGFLLGLDLINEYELGVSRRFGFTAEASARFAFASLSPFGFTELDSSVVSQQSPLFVPALGFVTARSPIAARSAAAPPWGFGLRANTALPFAIDSGRIETLFVTTNGFLNAGLGGNHVLRLRPALTFATNSNYAAPFALRGFSGSTAVTASGPGHFKAGLDYLPPHFLVDVPLFPSVGITRIGISAFAELTGGFSVEPFTYGIDEAIGAGVALTTVVSYLVDWPITAGVAVRLWPDRSPTFGPGDVSFFLELDLAESLAVIDSTLSHTDETIFNDIGTVRPRLPVGCCE